MAIKAIPDGYHTLTPYLVCQGAAEAIAFYIKAFGATEDADAGAGWRRDACRTSYRHLDADVVGREPRARRALAQDRWRHAGVGVHLHRGRRRDLYARAVKAGAQGWHHQPTCSGATVSRRSSIRSATRGPWPRTRRTSRQKRWAGECRRRRNRRDGAATSAARNAVAVSANGAACSPKIGPWPPCGTTHSDESGDAAIEFDGEFHRIQRIAIAVHDQRSRR